MRTTVAESEETTILNALIYSIHAARCAVLDRAFELRRSRHRELQDKVLELSFQLEEAADAIEQAFEKPRTGAKKAVAK